MNEDDKKLDKNLTSDAEFADLMDAEFAADGKPVDVLSKKRTWEEIEQRTRGLAPDALPEPGQGEDAGDKFWQVGLALAACILLSIGISLVRPLMEPDQGIKGIDTPVPVEIVAYEIGSDGDMRLFDPENAQPPLTLVPMVLATQNVYAAFLRIRSNGVPEVIAAGQRIAAGEEQAFSVSDEDFFAIDWEGDRREVYCVVAFELESELDAELARLAKEESFAFDGNCLVLTEAE